jgi:hypothetical protein
MIPQPEKYSKNLLQRQSLKSRKQKQTASEATAKFHISINHGGQPYGRNLHFPIGVRKFNFPPTYEYWE